MNAARAKATAISSEPDPVAGGLEALLVENRAALIRYLRARQVSQEEAEDLLQELFVKLRTHPTGPIAGARAYLYRMAENLLTDRHRSESRRRGREEAWVSAQSGDTLDTYDQPPPDRALIAREELVAVAAALAVLPARTVSIFRSYRIEGVTRKQIALDLGISVSAVEKHLQRAYQVVVEAQAKIDGDSGVRRRP
jgi:RNA polymerase sigma-70 factor (ECF subfamily)